MPETITQIRKRSGGIVDFDQKKITNAIIKAAEAVGILDEELANKLSEEVTEILKGKFHFRSIPAVEEIQDIVEEVLIKNRQIKIAKAYILYRDQRARLRDLKSSMINSNELMEEYIKQADWRVKENSNMGYSLQGLNNHLASAISSHYWLNKVYTTNIREAHKSGDFHLHDLQLLAPYCAGWDLKDLLIQGFRGVSGKVESKPAKHFRTALGQVTNFFYTLQGEVAGAEAFSNFDTYLAPFIKYDSLSYEEVKQCLQEFLFNINVPTRVGFQCLSEDSEILGKDGWKRYNQVRAGDLIATFNLTGGFIEYLPVERVFAKEYKGDMYNLRNRISDQLISPEHRVVRRRFGAEGYILEKIEKIVELKSPFIIPVGSEGHIKGSDEIDEDIIKLIAWVVAEGSLDSKGRGSGRVSIYQSKIKNPKDYEEIISICNNLKLKYTERTQKGLGAECNVIRFDANSTRKIFEYFNSNKKKGIKFIPQVIIQLGAESARLFLETYIKGDGCDGCKIITTSEKIRDGLMQIIVNAGFGATVSVRRVDNKLSKKLRYIIRVIKHRDTYINIVKKIKYKGVIWCPKTKNETVIARRKGKIFITGNTPFTNITLDLTPGKSVGEENIIVGGQVQPEKYKDFQKEMDMFNIAFAELMMVGDAKGRVFTFPIPTYNITNDFLWDSLVATKIFEMTAKYGIPYFSNFINSDMNPEDARSMCCRLRLDNRELKKRGGALFGANPLTGSIGVVTINLPRLGYLAKTKEEFFSRLDNLMQIAQESLETKRDVLEKLTEGGLYPYARHYLSSVKERFNGYWNNHFSTIGIIGMNEALLNFAPLRSDITTPAGKEFTLRVLDYMREKIMDYQIKTNHLYNLEATPAEGTSRRLSRIDKDKYPDIIVANEEAVRTRKAAPYYTNSSQLPVNYTDDLFEALDLQDDIQIKYTGGTVFHSFIGEALPSAESVKKLVKTIVHNYHLPYFTITPTFSICPKHGYISGEHQFCPKCDEEIGYGERPNPGKEEVYAGPVKKEDDSSKLDRDIIGAIA